MKKLSLLLVLIMIIAAFGGCAAGVTGGGDSSTTGSGDSGSGGGSDGEGGTARDDVVIRVESPWGTYNPLQSALYVEFYEINQMYEALTWVADNGDIEPILAESWDVSDDGLEYTFKLREGVLFHNGEELKASDVAFTFEKGLESAALRSYFGPVNGAEAIDDYNVKVTLDAPFAPLLGFLSNVRIVNEKFYNEVDGDLRTQACGTGPYQLVEVDMNSYCKMTAFPEYWRGEAAIKNITFTVIMDDTTAAVAYMAGEVDFISTSASQYLEISAQPELYDFVATPTKHTALIYMNQEREPYNNQLVRQALQHALDRETMIQVAFEGFAVPAYLQGDESCFGVDYDHVNMYDYDLDKARELLAEAGYPDGVDLGQMITISGTYFDKCAVVFQSSLAEIGCTIEIVSMENTAMTAMTLAGEYDMMTGGQSFLTDFAGSSKNYHSSYIGSNNYSRIRNDRLDELFELAEVETDSGKRLELYAEAIDIITEDASNMPMFHKNLLFAWTQGMNCVVHPDSAMPYFVYNWSW